jgi:hypothetical protein
MPTLTGFAVKCGRCGVTFTTPNVPKLDHFSIYRVTCPHCQWPGRYLASELRPVTGANPYPMPRRSKVA